ncbi:hypothetical protein Pelo_4708 [Pelomyxa schiedti]|nr:hypothetical protein Pelo_4708 [Pelomyxa schiedti]
MAYNVGEPSKFSPSTTSLYMRMNMDTGGGGGGGCWPGGDQAAAAPGVLFHHGSGGTAGATQGGTMEGTTGGAQGGIGINNNNGVMARINMHVRSGTRKVVLVLYYTSDKQSLYYVGSHLRYLLTEPWPTAVNYDSALRDQFKPITASPPVVVVMAQCPAEWIVTKSPDDTGKGTDTPAAAHSLDIIYWAFVSSAARVLTGEQTGLPEILSLVMEASKQDGLVYKSHDFILKETRHPTGGAQPVPIPNNPAGASPETARTLLQCIHDHRTVFPCLSESLVLRTWVRAKNWAAVTEVCRACCMTEGQEIDLSNLSLDSVPEALRGLTCKKLDLSNNNISVVPRWMVDMKSAVLTPNPLKVPLGAMKECMYLDLGKLGNIVESHIHKVVFIGDTGAGKTTLLKCMMEKKKKLQVEHSHTGIAIHHNVKFKSKGVCWTVWDLGGDSLSPFHWMFLRSRSIFVLVFDIRKVADGSRLYYWLNQIASAQGPILERKSRSVILVGTHLDGMDPITAQSTLQRLFHGAFQNTTFLINLRIGKGLKNEGTTLLECHNPITSIVHHLEAVSNSDGILTAVPQSWIRLHNKMNKLRNKLPASRIRWSSLCNIARKVGVVRDMEQCANYLFDIGTIIHFRTPYPFSSDISLALEMKMAEQLIMDPQLLFQALIDDISQLSMVSSGFEWMTFPYELVWKLIFPHEKKEVSVLFCYSLFPLENIDWDRVVFKDSHESWMAFWAPPPEAREFFAMNGRSIKLSLLSTELFFKFVTQVSTLPGLRLHQESTLWRDCAMISCESNTEESSMLLLITRQDDTLSMCMRATGKEHSEILAQRRMWLCVMDVFTQLAESAVCRAAAFTNTGKPVALPPEAFCFTESQIIGAGVAGSQKLTCAKGIQVDLEQIAPDCTIKGSLSCAAVSPPGVQFGGNPLAPSYKLATEALCLNCATELSAPSIPPYLRDIIGTVEAISQPITLSELISQLQKETSPALFQRVMTTKLRERILKDVAQGLRHLHKHNPPAVHGSLSPGSITILSLDETTPEPLARISDFREARVLWGRVTRATPGTPPDTNFQSPEVLSHSFYGTAADIWSFGSLVMWMMDPLTSPFQYLITTPLSSSHNSTHQTHGRQAQPQQQPISHRSLSLCTQALYDCNTEGHPTMSLRPSAILDAIIAGDVVPWRDSTGDIVGGGEPVGVPSLGAHKASYVPDWARQIAMCCLVHDPSARPHIDKILTVWEYFH